MANLVNGYTILSLTIMKLHTGQHQRERGSNIVRNHKIILITTVTSQLQKTFPQDKTMNGHWHPSPLLFIFSFLFRIRNAKTFIPNSKTINGEMPNINTKTSTLSWEPRLPTRTQLSRCANTSPLRIRLLTRFSKYYFT